MYSKARMESPNSLLQAPGGLGFASTAMQNGSQGDFTGVTSLQSADVNVVFHQFDGGWNPRSPRPSQRVNWYDGGHLDWMTGFRWAGLDDVGILGFTPAGGSGSQHLQGAHLVEPLRRSGRRPGEDGVSGMGLGELDQGGPRRHLPLPDAVVSGSTRPA